MKVITVLSISKAVNLAIFMAGGVTNCPDWQQEMLELLKDCDLIVFNPRRNNFPIDDPKATYEQIKWEYERLHEADAVMFWFPCETLCPIALFELGAALERDQAIFIGVHPEYKRRQDVEIQTKLGGSSLVHSIVYSIPDLAEQIVEWSN
jgi:hypothetical protein